MKKICNFKGCGKLIERGKSYCIIHSKTHDYKYKNNYWKRIRAVKILNNPLCELCEIKGLTKKAQIVHHVKDAQFFPEFFYDLDNLQSVCRSCHKKIHDDQNKKNNNKLGININGRMTYIEK